MKFRGYSYSSAILKHQYHPLSLTHTHKLLFPFAYILAWTCRQQSWQQSSGEVPSSCSRGLVGVGGQFCSRKEKQISGMRGLVLFRLVQVNVNSLFGEEDLEVSVPVTCLLSSALSSACRCKRTCDFYVSLQDTFYRWRWAKYISHLT